MDIVCYVCLSFVSILYFVRVKITEKENEKLREELQLYRFNAEKTLNKILEIIKDSEENSDYTYSPLKRIKRIIKKALG